MATSTASAPSPFVALQTRVLLVLVAGVSVGSLTSIGQRYLDGAVNPFVDSASAWLVAPFALGSIMATRRGAAAAGLAVGGLQFAGYYATAHLRGSPASASIVAFWAACTLVGGPLFGAAGHLWRTSRPPLRGLGLAVLAGAFLAERLWVYIHELHYFDGAAVWLGIGTAIAAATARRPRELAWLLLTVPVGLACELFLTRIYAQSSRPSRPFTRNGGHARQGNTEGTPSRPSTGTHGHSSSAVRFFLRRFRARRFPALPAVPASLLDGKDGVASSILAGAPHRL